jgi:hypothetical protein
VNRVGWWPGAVRWCAGDASRVRVIMERGGRVLMRGGTGVPSVVCMSGGVCNGPGPGRTLARYSADRERCGGEERERAGSGPSGPFRPVRGERYKSERELTAQACADAHSINGPVCWPSELSLHTGGALGLGPRLVQHGGVLRVAPEVVGVEARTCAVNASTGSRIGPPPEVKVKDREPRTGLECSVLKDVRRTADPVVWL